CCCSRASGSAGATAQLHRAPVSRAPNSKRNSKERARIGPLLAGEPDHVGERGGSPGSGGPDSHEKDLLGGVQFGESCECQTGLDRCAHCWQGLFLERHVRVERVPPDDPSVVDREYGSLTHLALAE